MIRLVCCPKTNVCIPTKRLNGRVRDDNVSWSIGRTIQESGIAAIEAIGSDHPHLGPVSEEDMVFKNSHPKRMWRLRCTVEDYFPEKQKQKKNSHTSDVTLRETQHIPTKAEKSQTCPNRCM